VEEEEEEQEVWGRCRERQLLQRAYAMRMEC
jgi:hypothetical protein